MRHNREGQLNPGFIRQAAVLLLNPRLGDPRVGSAGGEVVISGVGGSTSSGQGRGHEQDDEGVGGDCCTCKQVTGRGSGKGR